MQNVTEYVVLFLLGCVIGLNVISMRSKPPEHPPKLILKHEDMVKILNSLRSNEGEGIIMVIPDAHKRPMQQMLSDLLRDEGLQLRDGWKSS